MSELPADRTLTDGVREVVAMHARLPDTDAIADDLDLFDAGMTSQASVNVMLALEDTFAVEFPDVMLKRSVFCSVAALSAAVAELQRAVT